MKIDIFNAEEKYDILYTDPPWQQGRGGKKAARPNSTGTTVPSSSGKRILERGIRGRQCSAGLLKP